MVLPHLQVIRAAAAPVSSTHPSPQLHRVRILHLGPRPQSPSPHSAPAPPHSYPGTGPPVPDQSPSSHFSPGGLGPDPSPQLPRDRARSPHLRISAPGTRARPRPTAAPGPSPLSHKPPSPRPLPFTRPSSLETQVFPPTPWSRMAGAFRARSFKFSCDRVRELANVGSSHRGRFFWARLDPHGVRAVACRSSRVHLRSDGWLQENTPCN